MFLYKQNLDALLTFLVYVISLWSTKCLRTHTHASENNRIFSVDKILRAHFGLRVSQKLFALQIIA